MLDLLNLTDEEVFELEGRRFCISEELEILAKKVKDRTAKKKILEIRKEVERIFDRNWINGDPEE